MSARSKRPTEDEKTNVFDTGRSRTVRPTQKGMGKPSEEERRRVVEMTTPTQVQPQPSEPIRVISMKTPAEIAAEKRALAAKNHMVQIRAISEVNRHDTPTNLGRLAPPRDPAGARARKLRDLVMWGSAVLLVAMAVMLGVWFLAR